MNDFRNDKRFVSDARQMIDHHVSAALPTNGPVEDGLDVHSVLIDVGSSISVRFHHWFLDPCAACPVSYSLAVVGGTIHRAQFAFGHRDEYGRLKYNDTDKHYGRFESFPDSPSEWAHFMTREYTIRHDSEQATPSLADQPPLRGYMRRSSAGGR